MRTAEGKNGLVLCLLKFGQIASISDRAWRDRRDATIELMDMANIGDEERMKEIRKMLELRGTRLPPIMYSVTINGAMDIVSTACKLQKIDFDRFTDDMHPDDLTHAAGELIGLNRPEVPPVGGRKAATTE